jgi:cell division protein FtsI/penicillin-binding protein 2
MSDRLQGFRFVVCIGVVLLAAAGLGVRLALLHVGPDDGLRTRVRQARSFEREIEAPRGNIYDSAGKANILAIDLVLKDVCADPQLIAASTNRLRIVNLLSQQLALPADEVAAMLNCPTRRYKRIKAAIHQDAADQLAQTLKEAKLVLDWRKKQRTRADVYTTVKTVLDELPRAYTPELYEQKCDVVYQHVYDSYQGEGRSIYVGAPVRS